MGTDRHNLSTNKSLQRDKSRQPEAFLLNSIGETYYTVDGTDPYMDIFVGRFSAENVAQVETQVLRSVWYERDIVDGDWLAKGMGVASNQGTGDDNEYDNAHMDVIRQKLLDFGYTEVDQIYDPSANSTQVANALNDGRGIVNYTRHGSNTSWSSSGFSIGNVNNLTKNGHLALQVMSP